MEQSKKRLEILNRIEEFEKQGIFDKDVEDDLEALELLPNKIDYLNKKLSSKILNIISNKLAVNFFEKLIKNKQLIIKKVVGIENYLKVEGGAFITCNHFNPCDNYAVYRVIKPYFKKHQKLYKVIREGNYTNFPGLIGFFFKHSNTLPLSRNTDTMKKFLKSVSVLLKRGEKILIYPEQSMWWNYKKPRPLQNGAFNLAVKNNVPVIPVFITMQDSCVLDSEGFFVQEYIMNFCEPIYPDKNLDKKQNIEFMKNKNYEVWKEIYEKFYDKKLEY